MKNARKFSILYLQLTLGFLKSLFLLLFVSATLTGYGQTNFRPGYYITWENDTVRGLIDYRGEVRNSALCFFKKDETSAPLRFGPDEIQAYRFTDGKYYISQTINLQGEDKKVFLEFLVNGITNLYFYRDINNYSYFIEDRNGKWIELTNELITENRDGKGSIQRSSNRYKGQLKATFADNDQIQPQIDHVSLGHKSLISLTRNYHDYVCNDQECIIYEKKLPLLKLRFAPVVSSGVSFFSFRDGIHSRYNYSPGIYPSAGVLLNAGLPGRNEKLSLEAELDFNSYSFHGSYEEPNGMIMEYYDAYLEMIAFQPSLAVKYTYPTGKIKPTISAGVFTNIFLTTHQKVVTLKVHPDTEYTHISYETPLAPYVSGGFLQLGCNYMMFGNHTTFTNLRFCHAAKRDHGIRTMIQSVNLNVGMFLSK